MPQRLICIHGITPKNSCAVCRQAFFKQYRLTNKDKIKANNRRTRKEYYKANRTLVILDSLNRRAKKVGAEGVITLEYYNSIIHKPCPYCGQSGLPMELDHKVSLSRGGTNLPENVQAVCQFCNKAKHWYGEEDFLKWLNGVEKSRAS